MSKDLNTTIGSKATPATAEEVASDRLQIRRLIDAYAHCADRRDAAGQMALFTEDTHFVVFMDARNTEPSMDLHGRDSLKPVFENLKTYDTTTHFNGQSTIDIDGNRATGESYCLAHHLSVVDGQRTLMIASLRYQDVITKQNGKWLFAERKLLVDWQETRLSKP